MDLLVVGISHATAPVEVREQVAFMEGELQAAVAALRDTTDADEAVILSTCNRTELYLFGGDSQRALAWLGERKQLPRAVLTNMTYIHEGEAALAHVMRVAAGLDSMVLGEPQILGQVKDAFSKATASGAGRGRMEKFSQHLFRSAKRVRTNTAIGANPVSVASTSVTLAGQLFSDIATCKALLIGAGDTITLVARHLRTAGINGMTIANRTLANAERLASEVGGQAIDLAAVAAHVEDADIVIACTGAELPTLGKGTVESAMKARRHRPIFMVDLGVPRDIEPEIANLSDIYLYTVDDMHEIVSDNLKERESAAAEAELLIANAVADYLAEKKALSAVDTLVAFRRKHEQIKEDELARALDRLAKGEDAETVLKQFARQVTNKIIHAPTAELKRAASEDRHDVIAAVRRLFQLEDPPAQ